MFHNLRTEVKRFQERPRGCMSVGLPTIKVCPYALDRLLIEYDRLKQQNAALVEAMTGLADEYIDRRCQFGHEHLWKKHEVTDAVNRAIRLIVQYRAESAEGDSDG